jgi:catechol 2,3-dioxygenase-like lactoylglutathione lyase family enzyme
MAEALHRALKECDTGGMQLPTIAGLCPLIQVFDMLESVRFYCEQLGFEIEQQSPIVERPYLHFNWALLKRGDVALMLNTAYEADERPTSRDIGRAAAHQDTILYFDCPEVDKAYALLRSAGFDIDQPTVNHGMKGFHFADPDGFGLCFHWPAHDARGESE